MPSGKQDAIDEKVQHALANRVDRISLVLECCSDNKNYLACLRTCDILGIQNVWIIEQPLPAPRASKQSLAGIANGNKQLSWVQDKRLPVEQGRKKGRIARASTQWLDIKHFSNTQECIRHLKVDGWTIWATDLNAGAVSLEHPGLQLPHQLAVVLGNESRGVSQEMREAADRCVYLPMYGFTESLNISVAAALVLQHLITADPAVRGDLVGPRRAEQLESKWRAAASRAHDNRAGVVQQQRQQCIRQRGHHKGRQQQGQHLGTVQEQQQGPLMHEGQALAELAGLSIQTF